MPKPIKSLWTRAYDVSPAATWMTLVLVIGAIGSLFGIALDDRQLLGVAVWIKPFKFFASFAVLGATVLVLIAQLPRGTRARRFIEVGLTVSVLVIMVGIAGQAARGTMSHSNITTPIDTIVFYVLGAMVVVFQAALITLAVRLSRARIADRAFAAGLRWGLAILVIGTTVTGVAMIAPIDRAARIAVAAKYGIVSAGGGHAVGAPDDGPGLPFVGWSTLGGDLRPAHFVAIHALQVFALFGWWMSRRKGGRGDEGDPGDERDGVAIVRGVAVGYLGIMFALTAQALRGQSVIAPDAATFVTFAAAIAIGASYVWWWRRSPLAMVAEVRP
jgi:hypothetical protein